MGHLFTTLSHQFCPLLDFDIDKYLWHSKYISDLGWVFESHVYSVCYFGPLILGPSCVLIVCTYGFQTPSQGLIYILSAIVISIKWCLKATYTKN